MRTDDRRDKCKQALRKHRPRNDLLHPVPLCCTYHGVDVEHESQIKVPGGAGGSTRPMVSRGSWHADWLKSHRPAKRKEIRWPRLRAGICNHLSPSYSATADEQGLELGASFRFVNVTQAGEEPCFRGGSALVHKSLGNMRSVMPTLRLADNDNSCTLLLPSVGVENCLLPDESKVVCCVH
jgi:hypothetical protein